MNPIMRTTTEKERTKHGCIYCEHVERQNKTGRGVYFCPFNACPYAKEFERYTTYNEYFRSKGVCLWEN